MHCIYCGKGRRRICDWCAEETDGGYDNEIRGFMRMKLKHGRKLIWDYWHNIISTRPRFVRQVPATPGEREPGTWTGDTQTVFIVCCNIHCRALIKAEFDYVNTPADEDDNGGHGNCVTCPQCATHHMVRLKDARKARQQTRLEFAR